MKNQALPKSSPLLPSSTRRKGERGNVFFLIFIGIALFGALSYAIIQGFRSGESHLTDQQATLYASDISTLGNAVRDAVKALKISNGCQDTVLNFYSPTPDYFPANAAAPADKSCDVFNKDGGGLYFKRRAVTKLTHKFTVHYAASNHFQDLGTNCAAPPNDTCNDLALFIVDLPLSVCQKINEKLGISQAGFTTPEISDITLGTGFAGSYAGTNKVGDAGNHTALKGRPSGCVKEVGPQSYTSDESTTQTPYIFYQVLLAR